MASITAWAKKVWKDRKTEYPTRRTLTKTNGSQEIVTVTRNEGSVSQEGDAFSAENMNDLEERIDAGFTEVTRKLQWEKYVIPTVLKDMPTGTFKTETFSELIGAKEFLVIVNDIYPAYINNDIGLSAVSSNVNFPYGENYGYRFAISIRNNGVVDVYMEFIGTFVKTLTITKIYYRK